MSHRLARVVSAFAMVTLAAGIAASAAAQPYPNDYRTGRNFYDPNYEQHAPQGYDGREAPPPPPGWSQPNDWSVRQDANDRYARAAQTWAQNNCVKSQSNTGVGAVIGGVLGAVIGNSVAGRHDRTFGTIAGAAIGAAGGAAIGSTTGGRTSPGCPPGYVMRSGSRAYDYSAAGYNYAAPRWYKPWVNSRGTWYYRPYPYGSFYYNHYVARDRYNRFDNRRPGYGDRRDGWYDRYGRYHSNDGSWYDRDGIFHMGQR